MGRITGNCYGKSLRNFRRIPARKPPGSRHSNDKVINGRSHELEQMENHSTEMMMIHKFVLCIYALAPEESWITLELCRIFTPTFYPSLSSTFMRSRKNSFETPVTTTKGISSTSHGVLIWIVRICVTKFSSSVIDEVRVKNPS